MDLSTLAALAHRHPLIVGGLIGAVVLVVLLAPRGQGDGDAPSLMPPTWTDGGGSGPGCGGDPNS